MIKSQLLWLLETHVSVFKCWEWSERNEMNGVVRLSFHMFLHLKSSPKHRNDFVTVLFKKLHVQSIPTMVFLIATTPMRLLSL